MSFLLRLGNSQIATSSSERNEISIWNLNFPYIPVCVLSGHTEPCVDFRWVDTPDPIGILGYTIHFMKRNYYTTNCKSIETNFHSRQQRASDTV